MGSNSVSSCCSSAISVPNNFRYSKRLENILENENPSVNILIKSESFDERQLHNPKVKCHDLSNLNQKNRSRARSEPPLISETFFRPNKFQTTK